jgi:hypothetical protein
MQASPKTTLATASPAKEDGHEALPVKPHLLGPMFSFETVCFFVIVLLLFALASKRFVEPDFWWHLRNGQAIFVQHSIPRVDTYSFGAAGSPWLDHEWLSEFLFFAGYRIGGLRGVMAVYFGLLVLIYAGVYYLACKSGADAISALLATSLAVLLGAVSIGPRPLLFGWLCLVGLLLVFHQFQRSTRSLWLLPPLFALWINLHGSWVFGMVVFGLIAASGLIEGEWGLVVARRWTPAQLKALTLAFCSSVAALFVNPFGYRLVLYPFDLLGRQQSMVLHTEEWQSVDFGKVSGKLALLTLLALLLAAVLSRRRWRLDQLLLMVFALWTGLLHVRMLFFLGLIMAPILAARLNLFPPVGSQRNRPWVNAAIVATMAAWVLWSFPAQATIQHDIDSKFPTAALAFMKGQHITGRIFNEDWWGGYMEWTMPAPKPFTDGRADIFVYNGTFDDYIRAVRISKPFDVMDKYHMQYALLEPGEPLVYVLKRDPAWREIYSDNVAVLLARTQPSDRD